VTTAAAAVAAAPVGSEVSMLTSSEV
jgi:hypothetical protein